MEGPSGLSSQGRRSVGVRLGFDMGEGEGFSPSPAPTARPASRPPLGPGLFPTSGTVGPMSLGDLL